MSRTEQKRKGFRGLNTIRLDNRTYLLPSKFKSAKLNK